MDEILAETRLGSEEESMGDWVRILLPRILRAAFWGFIMGGELLLTLFLPGVGGEYLRYLPLEEAGFSRILLLFVGFEVAIQLLRGTIFPHALRTGRALLSMILLVSITNGGVISMSVQPSPGTPLPPGMSVVFSIDFKPVLGTFLLLSLLSVVKNVMSAVHFMAEKEETGLPPELP